MRGPLAPADRASELYQYCMSHLEKEGSELYRIFYYDCDPVGKKAYHPLLDRTVDLSKTDEFAWKNEFFRQLARRRKVAIRKGEPLEGRCEYVMKGDVSKAITRGKRDASSLTETDFVLNLEQKGVDVRIGLDVALISAERYADKMVLVTGDSDFVPAAKYARRHGVDFILDNMWHPVRESLLEHVDGLFTPWPRPKGR